MVNLKRALYLMPLLGGCYSYTPIDFAAAPAGSDVRTRISGAALDRVAPLLGSFDTRVFTGTVVENSAGTMVLEVPTGAMSNVVADVVQLHARIPLFPADMVSLEQRKLDVGRTSILAGVIAAGVGLGVAAALHAGGGSSEEGRQPGEPPPVNRIPILRFHF
jgi:hypothetical protein